MFMENLFSDYLLPVTLGIITLGTGLSIEFRDFRNIFLYPKAVLVGLVSQMLLLPLIALVISLLIPMDPVYKVGLILIAACPGGATSNLVNFLLSGNVALSISITVLNSLITLVTIPLIVSTAIWLFMSQQTAIQLPVFYTILNIFLVTAVPATIGVLIRHYMPRFAISLEKPLRIILPLLLLGVFSGVVFIDQSEESSHMMEYIELFPPALFLNFLSMIAGWFAARSLHLSSRNQFTISIEVGLQNSALAIFVATTLLNSPSMAIVPVIYGSFSFFTTAFIGYGIKRISLRQVREKAAETRRQRKSRKDLNL